MIEAKVIPEKRCIEWFEPKTVLYYSGRLLKNAKKDMEWYAKKFNEMGIKTKVVSYRYEIITERVRVKFHTDDTILCEIRADEVFGFNDRYTRLLRKPQSKNPFKGALTTYVGLAHSMGVY